MSILVGLYWAGAVLVLILGFAVGYAARGDENRHYFASRQRYEDSLTPAPAPQPVTATAHRVLPQPAPQNVTNVYLAPAHPGMPAPVDLDAIQRRPMVLDAPRETA